MMCVFCLRGALRGVRVPQLSMEAILKRIRCELKLFRAFGNSFGWARIWTPQHGISSFSFRVPTPGPPTDLRPAFFSSLCLQVLSRQ